MNSQSLPHPDLILDIDARADLLCIIRHALRAWCRQVGVDAARADRICLAVDEGAANIVRHAYRRTRGRIRFAAGHDRSTDPPMLQFTLEDDGEQVDLDTIRPRELDDVRPGGLGIHLIREVMGEAIWEHLPEGGTRLTMRAVPASTAQDHREETTHYAW